MKTELPQETQSALLRAGFNKLNETGQDLFLKLAENLVAMQEKTDAARKDGKEHQGVNPSQD
ncbi:MAG: hypothetical protein LBQ57_04480 [Spirochaetales bacterium]|nr:hypothetical protein [Spirochaetales bacterium]